MSIVSLEAHGLSKAFTSRLVITNLTFSAISGEVIGILGANGSGKSTVVRMIAGVLRPDSGYMKLHVGTSEIPRNAHPLSSGLVAPYLQVYEEFTPLELLSIHSAMRGLPSQSRADERVLERVGLITRKDDHIKTFSSGLRQRMILALAVHLDPPLLLLDEPSVTMDDEGRRIVDNEITLQRERGGIVFLATNDSREHALCTRTMLLV